MKRKLNKRLLSAVLAAVMLITAVPLYAVNNSAPGSADVLLTVEGDSAYPYLDGFFVVKGNDGEKAEVSYVGGDFKEAVKLGTFRSVHGVDDCGLNVEDLDGSIMKLLPNGKTYSYVYEYSDSLLKALQGGESSELKCGLIDKKGEQVIECKWQSIDPLTKDYINLTAFDGTKAIADNSGKILLDSIKTDSVSVVADGGDDIVFSFNDGAEKLFFPESGQVRISGEDYKTNAVYDEETGLILVKNDDGLYGYADGQGKVVIDYRYAAAEPFSEGVAAVCDKTTMLWGYIGPDGNTVLDFKYTFAGEFGEGLAFVEETETLPEEPSSEETTEEPSSEEVPSEPDSSEESSLEESSSEETSSEDTSSEESSSEETVTEPSSEHPELYSEIKVVRKAINKSGETVFELPEGMASVSPYYGGYDIVTNDASQYGLIDREGKLAVPYGDKEIAPYKFGSYVLGGSLVINGAVTEFVPETAEDDYIVARKNGKYGILNSKLETVVGFEYDGAGYSREYPYLFAVKKGDKWAAADMSGKVITDYIFDDAFLNKDGFPYAVSSNGTVYKKTKEDNGKLCGIVNEKGQLGLLNKESGALLLGGKFFDNFNGGYVYLLGDVCIIEESYYKKIMLNISDGSVVSENLGMTYYRGECVVSETNVVYNAQGDKAYYLPVSVNDYITEYNPSSNVFAVDIQEQTEDGNTKLYISFVKARPYDIESVEVVNMPVKTEYVENLDGYSVNGEPFVYSVSLEGMAVKITYTDGTRETVAYDVENKAFDTYDPCRFEGAGEYEVPFSYLGVDLSVTVKVIENPLTKMEIVTNPTRTEYISGSYPDLGGAVLKLTYKDGTSAEVPLKQNIGCCNEYFDTCLNRGELISWRWENPEILTGSTVSGEQNIIIEYLGKEIAFAVDVSPNLAAGIELIGGHSENLVITAANTDDTETEFTVLDFISLAGGENVVIGALITDKGIFNAKLYCSQAENGQCSYSKMEIFGREDNIPENCTFLEVIRVSQNLEFLSAPLGVNLTSFTGNVTKENIDALVSLSFYNADVGRQFAAEFDEKTGEYVYLVPKSDAEKYINGMFKVNGAIDFTLSENYDKVSGKIAVPDLSYGYGPVTTEKTYRFEDGLWYAQCDGYPVGKITTVFDFNSGKITAYYFNEKKIESISVNKNPYKYEYTQGEPLNTAGLELKLLYSDGTTKIISKDFEVTGFDPDKLGEQTVKVTFAGKETSFKVKVVAKRPPQPETPDKITSDKYKIENGYILEIPEGTSVNNFLKNINEREYVKVFRGNEEVTGDVCVGTKMVVKLMDGTHIKQTLILSVRGDNSGEGIITITDMIAVKSHLLGKTTLNGAAFYASDINRDKKVTITDFIQIKSHLLGKSHIK